MALFVEKSSFKFDLLLNQTDFDDICDVWNLSEPLNDNDLSNIFSSLLKKIYNKLIFQWETNHSSKSEQDKQLLIKFWTTNYEESHESTYHCNDWLHILEQQTPNKQYTMKQCLNTLNETIVMSAMESLNHIYIKILNKSPTPTTRSECVEYDTKINDIRNKPNYISTIATMPLPPKINIKCEKKSSNNDSAINDDNMPQFRRSRAILHIPSTQKASSLSLPDSTTLSVNINNMDLSKNRSKSADQRIAMDGVTAFNKILQIADHNKLQKALCVQKNWDLLVDEIYANLNSSNYKLVFDTLQRITDHIFEDDPKYRKIYTNNKKIQSRILIHRGGYEFLFGIGFRKESKTTLLCKNPHFEIIAAALTALRRKSVLFTKIAQQQISNDDTKCVDNMKEDLLDLMEMINKFGKLYDTNKLKEMNENWKELLLSEKEIEDGILCMNDFVDTLTNIKSYITMLDKPDISRYIEWDIDVTMKWIESLENGRFIKYIEILRKGFISDGITGSLLPQITNNDLRSEPFGITNFSERKALIKYFENLKNNKPDLTNQRNEGNETEYI